MLARAADPAIFERVRSTQIRADGRMRKERAVAAVSVAVRGSKRPRIGRVRGLDGVLSECARGPAHPLVKLKKRGGERNGQRNGARGGFRVTHGITLYVLLRFFLSPLLIEQVAALCYSESVGVACFVVCVYTVTIHERHRPRNVRPDILYDTHAPLRLYRPYFSLSCNNNNRTRSPV